MVSWSGNRLVSILLAAAVLAGGAAPDAPRSQPPDGPAATAPPDPQPRFAGRAPAAPRTPSDTLAAALDSVVREEMGRGRVPGAVLVTLRGGEIAFARGYGAADLASGRPLHPDETLFPLGSLSKLVTATAVMQLVESGRVDLHEPAETYLPAGVLPDGPGGPITVHHLLTHTAGFEPANLGVAARRPGEIRGLEAFLSSRPSRRVRPPGELYVYSQHGYGLLGLVVEEVSGRDFPGYVRDEIFTPLGMESARFRRRAASEERMAVGYYGGERRQPAPAVHHRIPPAGGLVASPTDVARLLAAHLSGGGPILGEAASRVMTRRQWSPHPDPRVEGTSYGLFEYRACGLRALTSRGWVGGHASYVHLVPGREAGFLITTNASELGGIDQRLRETFHALLAGGSCAGASGAGAAGGDGGGDGDVSAGAGSARPGSPDVEGSYRSIGYGGTGVEALGRLLLSPVLSVEREDGRLTMDFGSEAAELDRSDDLLYRTSWWEGRDQNFAFLDVVEGRPRYMMWGGQAYERIPGLAHPAVLWTLLGLTGLLFLGAVAAGAVRGVRWLAAGEGARETEGAGLPGRLALAVSVLLLAFGAGMAAELAGTARYRFAFGVPTTARLLLWIPTVTAALALALAGSLALEWRGRSAPPLRRLYWTAVAAAALGMSAATAAVGLLPPP